MIDTAGSREDIGDLWEQTEKASHVEEVLTGPLRIGAMAIEGFFGALIVFSAVFLYLMPELWFSTVSSALGIFTIAFFPFFAGFVIGGRHDRPIRAVIVSWISLISGLVLVGLVFSLPYVTGVVDPVSKYTSYAFGYPIFGFMLVSPTFTLGALMGSSNIAHD